MGSPLKLGPEGRDESRIHGEPRIQGDEAACAREVDLEYADIDRIAKTLAIAPLTFVALTGATALRPTLDLAGQSAGPTLRRHDGHCVFLLTLTSGRPLCGLGALAPAACLTTPSSPLPIHIDRTPTPSHQSELEARWRARLVGRTRPLDPESALAGLLSMMAEDKAP